MPFDRLSSFQKFQLARISCKIFFFVCDEEPLLGFQGPVLWPQISLSPLTRTGKTPPPYLSNHWSVETWNNRWVPRAIEPVWVYTVWHVGYHFLWSYAMASYPTPGGRFLNRIDATQMYSIVFFFPACVPGIDSLFFQIMSSNNLIWLCPLDVNCLW